MRTTFVTAALLFVFISGCKGPCTLVGCVSQVVLGVEDAAGQSLSAFKGTVTVDGLVTSVECGDAAASGGPGYSCRAGGVAVEVRKQNQIPDVLSVSLATPNGSASFEGDISVGTRQKYYPNGEACDDEGCETAAVDVMLQ